MRKGGLIVAAALLATAGISRAQAPAAPARAAGGTLSALSADITSDHSASAAFRQHARVQVS